MSVPLTGSSGLFTRIGHFLGTLNVINTYRGTTFPTIVDTIFADYASTDQNIVNTLYSNGFTYQNSSGQFVTYLQQLANNLIIQMVNEDMVQPGNANVTTAIQYILNQMVATSQSVAANTLGSSVTYGGSNIGNGIAIVSTLGKNGLAQQNLFAETITGSCTSDSQSGGARPGQENFFFRGQAGNLNTLSWLYPQGSGCQSGMQCISPSLSSVGGRQNYLSNSNFESWTTPNVPDNWTIAVGTAGTTVKESTSIFYDGLASLQIVGNSSELTALSQSFSLSGVSGQTSVVMLPIDQMGFSAYVYVDVVPAAGVLQFALTDGSGTILDDVQGVPASVSKTLSTLTMGTWTNVTAFFRTPRVLPSAVQLRIRLTTALSTGTNLFVDHVALAEPTSLYVGGPSAMIFQANTNWIQGDIINLIPTNVYGGSGGGFQNGFQKFYPMRANGFLLPTSGSPTISDSLITT